MGTSDENIFNGSYGKRARMSGLNNEWGLMRRDGIVNM